MMKQKFAIIALLLLPSGIQAQTVHKLSVSDAVNMAFTKLPSIKNLELDYKIQEEINATITAAAKPQVTGTAGMNYYPKLPQFLFPDGTATAIYSILKAEGVKDGAGNPINKDIPPALRQVSFQQPWNASAGIGINQLLFQPDVFVGLQARAASLEFSKNNIAVEKDKVREQAYKQYYAVLVSEKQIEYLEENITRLEKLKSDVEQLYKAGFREKLDIDKVEVPLNNLRSTKNVLENAVKLNYAALKFSIGLPQTDSVVLTDQITDAVLKASLPSDEEFDYNDRPEIQLLNTAKKLQILDLKRQKLSNYPTVAAFFNYQTQGQGPKFITNTQTFWITTGLVGLQMNIPIYNGGARKHKIKEAELKLTKVNNNIEQVKSAIDFEKTVNKNLFKNSILNLDVQRRNMELAKKIYNTTKKKYEQGLASSFELLTDQNAITETESKYFEALYQANIAKISYLKALGQLK